MPALAGEHLDADDPFVLGLVGEHGPGHAIADGVDAGDRRLKALVHANEAALVGLDAQLL